MELTSNQIELLITVIPLLASGLINNISLLHCKVVSVLSAILNQTTVGHAMGLTVLFFISMFLFCYAYLNGISIGEASVPGPSFDSSAISWDEDINKQIFISQIHHNNTYDVENLVNPSIESKSNENLTRFHLRKSQLWTKY